MSANAKNEKGVQLLHIPFSDVSAELLQCLHIHSNLQLKFETHGNQELQPLTLNANLAGKQENIFKGVKV